MDTNYYGTEQAVATTMKVVQNATGRMVATGCNRQEAYTAEVARMVEAGCKESASMAVAMAAVKVEAVMTAGTVTDMAAVVQAAYAEVFAEAGVKVNPAVVGVATYGMTAARAAREVR